MKADKASLLAAIAKKCYIISTKSKAQVFFNYSPHVKWYCVEFYKVGWMENGEDGGVKINWSTKITTINLSQTIKKLNKIASELGIKNA